MRSYKYLRLRPYDHRYLTITTTDAQTVAAILSGIEKLIGWSPAAKHEAHSYEVKRLRDRDDEVFVWTISWLGLNGWEPYAVHSDVYYGGDGKIRTDEVHHFRKEVQGSG